MHLVSTQTNFAEAKTMPQACLRSRRHNLLYPLADETVMGRCSSNTIQVVDRQASRKHAVVMRIDQDYWVFDLGSMNGTYINGNKIAVRTRLNEGDRVNIGLEEFIFSSR